MEDPESLREVARYEVPEAGAHNLWIEDDKMYVAYYQAGLRVVDVSGELRGDLFKQGREMAWFPTGTPDGNVANSPMAWGPQPFKGHVFVSDLNSGALGLCGSSPRTRRPCLEGSAALRGPSPGRGSPPESGGEPVRPAPRRPAPGPSHRSRSFQDRCTANPTSRPQRRTASTWPTSPPTW